MNGRNGTMLAAVGVWAAWCLAKSGPGLNAWSAAIDAWRRAPVSGMTVPGIFAALSGHFVVLFLAAVVVLGMLNLGWWFQKVLPSPPARDWERRAIGMLAGFGVVGAGHLGLALTGLFYPFLIYVGLVASVILPGSGSRLRDAVFLFRLPPVVKNGWFVFGVMPGLISVIAMFLPDTNGDVYINHQGFIEQCLRIHKFSGDGISGVQMYAMSADYAGAVAVATGWDACAHFINFATFAAAVALMAGWSADRGGPLAGALAAWMAVTFGLAGRLFFVAKNDLAAAAFALAGSILLVRGLSARSSGWLLMSALLFGFGASAKLNVLVLLGLGWTGLMVARLRMGTGAAKYGLAWLAVSLMPLLPWFSRGWLVGGNPVWPEMSGFFPGSLWSVEEGEALRLLHVEIGGGLPRSGFALEFMRSLVANQPVLAILVPVVLVSALSFGAEYSRLAVYGAAGTLALWVVLPERGMRYSLAAFLVLSACAGVAAAKYSVRLGPLQRKLFLAVGVTLGWMPVGDLMFSCLRPDGTLGYIVGSLGRDEYLATRLTSYWDARRMLSAAPGVRRLVGVMEDRCYHLPGRFLPETAYGRTWGWVLSRECITAGDIGRKLRQLNASHVLYNFVAAGTPHSYTSPFRWDDRMIGLWRDFIGGYLEPAGQTAVVDRGNGGFCLYRIRRVPVPHPEHQLSCLPGVESLLYAVTRHIPAGDWAAYIREAEALDRRIPGVDFIGELVARGYENTGQWERAYARYAPGVGRGILGIDNFWGMARAAAHLRRWEESRRLLGAVEIHYPDRREAARATGAQIDRIIAMGKGGTPAGVFLRW